MARKGRRRGGIEIEVFGPKKEGGEGNEYYQIMQIKE